MILGEERFSYLQQAENWTYSYAWAMEARYAVGAKMGIKFQGWGNNMGISSKNFQTTYC